MLGYILHNKINMRLYKNQRLFQPDLYEKLKILDYTTYLGLLAFPSFS